MKEFVFAFDIMKTHISEWESSVDKTILMNGNDLFIKNIDKVTRTFYSLDQTHNSNPIAIKGWF
jgi:hypothetical protein